jgi:hypothetical protein
MPQLGERSRATASATRTSAMAAPAPNRAHSHTANVGCITRTAKAHRMYPGQGWNDWSWAVQRPITTPTGTDASRRTIVTTRLIREC